MREPGGAEKRKEEQGQAAQAGAKNRKGAEAGRGEAELLGCNGVPKTVEVGCNKVSRRRCLRSAGLSGQREDLTSDVLAQDDAARLGRLVENAFPAAASAVRWVSLVICPDSIRSSRCCSKV